MNQWTRTALLSAILSGILLALPHIPADADRLASRSAERVVGDAVGALQVKGKLALSYDGPKTLEEATRKAFGSRLAGPEDSDAREVVLKLRRSQTHVMAEISSGSHRHRARRPLTSFRALIPPLLAVFIVLLTRRLVPALGAAIVAGAIVYTSPNPIDFIPRVADNYLWDILVDKFRIWILVFVFALIGTVNVASRAGGIAGLVAQVTKLASGVRSTRVATWMMGLVVFFDDYANTIVVGTAIRPLTDKLRISREKLAYLVDSTAAPVAGIALISTWVGYEVSLFDDMNRSLGLGRNGYDIFVSALPFRFYCFFTVIYVFVNAFTGRDFGPMRRAELRAAVTGQVHRKDANLPTNKAFSDVEPVEGAPLRWYNAIVPVGVVLLGSLIGLLYDGGGFGPVSEDFTALFSFATWRAALGAAENNTQVLGIAALVGSVVAIVMVSAQRILAPVEAMKAWAAGIRAMSMAVVILVLAWSIGDVCKDVGTADFLAATLRTALNPAWLPFAVFLLAGAIAFSTGTSWGTMAILIPSALPLAHEIGGGNLALIIVCGAAVLDGAIFGDHCSPISDTTLLSSIATSCDHLDHVKTQIPYALASMLVAALFGYLWWAMDFPAVVGWVLGTGAIVGIHYAVGRPAEVRERTVKL